jgi:hypothetical protein
MVSEMRQTDSKTTQSATTTKTIARNPRLHTAGFFNEKIEVTL